MKPDFPEIDIDLNARMTKNGYALRRGALDGLARLGLTIEQAVGRRFTFNGGDDTHAGGEPAEIVFDGTIVKDAEWGYLAAEDSKGIYWRPKREA